VGDPRGHYFKLLRNEGETYYVDIYEDEIRADISKTPLPIEEDIEVETMVIPGNPLPAGTLVYLTEGLRYFGDLGDLARKPGDLGDNALPLAASFTLADARNRLIKFWRGTVPLVTQQGNQPTRVLFNPPPYTDEPSIGFDHVDEILVEDVQAVEQAILLLDGVARYRLLLDFIHDDDVDAIVYHTLIRVTLP